MKIAFVTPGYDPQDVRRGSGTFYYLAQELQRQGCTLHFFGPLITPDPLPTRFSRWLTRHILGGRYLTYLDPWVAKARCRLLARQLEDVDYDFILTNDHGIAAENISDKPVVIYTDVMLPPRYKKSEYKPAAPFSNLPIVFVKLFQDTIRKSLKQAKLVVFPAEWQKEVALQYEASPDKISTIPFGANIPDPGRTVAENRDLKLINARFDLLFVGKDWKRKGGDTAIKVTERLRELGIDAYLHVVGLKLDDARPFVKSYGLLDKNNPADWALMDKLYRDAHVFIFPSLSEGSAIVPREASAYGLPTLAYRIDGLLGAVEDGVNGVLFDLSADEVSFVDEIQKWIDTPEQYKQMAKSAREFYEVNANWKISASELIKILESYFQN